MIDHLLISVPKDKYDQVLSFYLAALAPVGYKKIFAYPGVAGLGNSNVGVATGRADFWIATEGEAHAAGGGIVKGVGYHYAFGTKTHAVVNEFHEAAVKAGGTCNGKPGLRPMYHEDYYGAFIIDPVGNRIEVVCRQPDASAKTS